MNYDVLKDIGLSDHQVAAYSYLLKYGPALPPVLARKLKLTRSNAYKVLDQLIEMGLVSRTKADKKLLYKAEDPIVLASIVAEERNRLRLLESNTKKALVQLRQIYQKATGLSDVQSFQGLEAVKSLYKKQSNLKEPIYFIKTRSDIPFMGYETMDAVRKLSLKYGTRRYGIVPDAPEAAVDPAIDEEVGLTKTWINDEDYTAPVEWTAAGDELLILSFGSNSSAIRIKNEVVASAFKQLWAALDKNLRANSEYKKMPRKAKRVV
jgi:predicted transcriptional regulator